MSIKFKFIIIKSFVYEYEGLGRQDLLSMTSMSASKLVQKWIHYFFNFFYDRTTDYYGGYDTWFG